MPGHSKQPGFGLIELMISILIGAIVVGALTSIVVSILRTNNDNLAMTRLTQELRGAAELVTRDLRRASFTPRAVENIGRLNGGGTGTIVNPFSEMDFFSGSDEINFVTNPEGGPADCVFYSYDDPDEGTQGTLDAADNRGFRFDSEENAIQVLTGVAGGCGADDGWENLTDPNAVEITSFQFSTNNGQPFKAESAGDLEVTIREIVVTISGRVTSDTDIARTVTETIRVRNDLLEDNS